jgi:hypothetical protein
VRASLVPAQANRVNNKMYRRTVLKCAHIVPLGIELIGSFKFPELFAPCRIPVQALKNTACKV